MLRLLRRCQVSVSQVIDDLPFTAWLQSLSLQILRLWLPRPGPGRALHRVRAREEGAQRQRHPEAGGQDLEEAGRGQGEPRGD